MVEKEEILERQSRCSSELFYEEKEQTLNETVGGPQGKLEQEVKEALKERKNGRVAETSGLTVDLTKTPGMEGVVELISGK